VTLRPLLALLLVLVVSAHLTVPSGTEAQGAAVAPDPEGLELALRIPMERFDGVQFINAARGATTAVFEIYCGIGFLIPDPEDDGLSGADLGLGLGCLVGATALLVMTGLRVAAMGDDSEGWDRLRRFRAATGDGLTTSEIRAFEMELESEASAARFRRGISIALGVALVIASGLLIGFTASGDLEPTTGTTIAAGTGVVGLASLIPAFLDSPAEAAERAFREAL
jgi:hypothetical protein